MSNPKTVVESIVTSVAADATQKLIDAGILQPTHELIATHRYTSRGKLLISLCTQLPAVELDKKRGGPHSCKLTHCLSEDDWRAIFSASGLTSGAVNFLQQLKNGGNSPLIVDYKTRYESVNSIMKQNRLPYRLRPVVDSWPKPIVMMWSVGCKERRA
ncbi:MAG: hypothetical protein V1846_04990 [Candidatus Komeilibacteria bacterium]